MVVKRKVVGFVISSTLLIFLWVTISQNTGSGRFGVETSECLQRMKSCFAEIKAELSLTSDAITVGTVEQYCRATCRCTHAGKSGNTGWAWVPDLKKSDFVPDGPQSPRVILCHSPDYPHGDRDPRLWIMLLSDGSTKRVWCNTAVYRTWYSDVFMACKDGIPKSVL